MGDLPVCDRFLRMDPESLVDRDEDGIQNSSLIIYDVMTTSTVSPTAPPVRNLVPSWFKMLVPVICIIGLVGNLLNLVVLTRRRLLSSMQRLERCATYGLTALAVSDMLFCALVLPTSFLSPEWTSFNLNYRVYGLAMLHVFMMLSNWLIVIISINRFLVVMYPIHARHFLGSRKTLASIAIVCFCSVLFTLSYFMHKKVVPCTDLSGERHNEFAPVLPDLFDSIAWYNRWIWPVIAVFIPLLLLAVFNAALIREINNASLYRRSTSSRSRSRDTSYRVTLTLVTIVLMLFLLVVPSEIIKYINPYKWREVGVLVAHITNLLQATNFALNFFLYCVVNPYFRRTITDTFCGKNSNFVSQYSDASAMDETKSLNGSNNRCSTKTLHVHLDSSFKRPKSRRASSAKQNGGLGGPAQPLTAL